MTVGAQKVSEGGPRHLFLTPFFLRKILLCCEEKNFLSPLVRHIYLLVSCHLWVIKTKQEQKHELFFTIQSFWGEDQRYIYFSLLFFIWRFAKNFRHLLMTLGEIISTRWGGIFILALERRKSILVICNFSHRKFCRVFSP